MDMRHPHYHELRRTRNTRELRRLRRDMRRAERRAGMRISIREAVGHAATYAMVDFLFKPGDKGGFYWVSRTNCFQDVAGTIPCEDGDPVGVVKGSHGEDWLVGPANVDSRPTYRESTRPCIEFTLPLEENK